MPRYPKSATHPATQTRLIVGQRVERLDTDSLALLPTPARATAVPGTWGVSGVWWVAQSSAGNPLDNSNITIPLSLLSVCGGAN